MQGFTSHRSVKALRQYEKVASKQMQTACNILNGGAPARSLSTAVEKLPLEKFSHFLIKDKYRNSIGHIKCAA